LPLTNSTAIFLFPRIPQNYLREGKIFHEGGRARPNSVNETFAEERLSPGWLTARVRGRPHGVAIIRLTANAQHRAEAPLPKLSALPNAVQ
jgi:hypothetical protein